MSGEAALIPDLIRQTFADPPGAARRLLGLHLPTDTLWQALLLVAVLSALAVQVPALMMIDQTDEAAELPPILMASPLVMGLIQVGVLVIMVFAVHWVGRAFGGTGAFEGALTLVTWLQFVLIVLQILQSVLGLFAPLVAGLLFLASLGIFFWLLTHFVMVLHGFPSAGMVFVGIIVSMLGMMFGLSVLLSILGVTLNGELPSNV
ncbi:MAG: Yip1 family protein [Pseudomonadota bacterium]